MSPTHSVIPSQPCNRSAASVRRSLPHRTLLTLVRALEVSKVDYCNAVLAGIPGQLQNAVTIGTECVGSDNLLGEKKDHITPRLRELHWLRSRSVSSSGSGNVC